MRTRHRHRSQEIVFRANVNEAIQRYSGGNTGETAVDNGVAITAAFTCLTSQSPIAARFLANPQPPHEGG